TVEWAGLAALEYVATAYGLTPELMSFWREQRFLPVRLGHRQDPASGTRSVLAIAPQTTMGATGYQWCTEAARLAAESTLLHVDAARAMNDLAELQALALSTPPPPLTDHQQLRLNHWCHSHQPEAGLRPLLALALWHWLQVTLTGAEAVTVTAWCRHLWLGESWAEVQNTLGLADRKQLQSALRLALVQVLV
ncbi:MAG: GNAT family N-acetyltransferase, partial [Natronospirillum sp.]